MEDNIALIAAIILICCGIILLLNQAKTAKKTQKLHKWTLSDEIILDNQITGLQSTQTHIFITAGITSGECCIELFNRKSLIPISKSNTNCRKASSLVLFSNDEVLHLFDGKGDDTITAYDENLHSNELSTNERVKLQKATAFDGKLFSTKQIRNSTYLVSFNRNGSTFTENESELLLANSDSKIRAIDVDESGRIFILQHYPSSQRIIIRKISRDWKKITEIKVFKDVPKFVDIFLCTNKQKDHIAVSIDQKIYWFDSRGNDLPLEYNIDDDVQGTCWYFDRNSLFISPKKEEKYLLKVFQKQFE